MKTNINKVRRREAQFRLLVAALAIALFYSVGAAAADGAQPVKIDLDAAVKTAIEKSPMIAAARGDAAAAAARGGMAASQRRPSISASAFFTNGDMPGVISGPASVMPTALSSYPPTRAYDQNLMLMVPLDVSGKLSWTIKSAYRRAAAAGYDSERTKQDVVLATRAAYYDVLYREQRVGVFENAVKAASEMLKNEEAAVSAGKAPAYYLERDRAELAMNEQMLAETRREAATARIMLAMTMGLDPATPLELTGTLDAPDGSSAPVELPADTPDLAAARSRVDAAAASSSASKRAFGPDVGLTFMADRVSARDSETMDGTVAALVVALPLWDGGMRSAAKKESSAMREAAAQELRNTELGLKAEFASARLELDTAILNISTTETALKAAEENHRVAKIRYEAGKGILVEMLDALTALTRARVARVEAIRDALLARDMLLRLAGKL